MNSAIKTIAVTGPQGMLGRHVLAQLAQVGIASNALGRDQWDFLKPCSIEQVKKLVIGSDAVIHCGAMTPQPGLKLDQISLFDANVRTSVILGMVAAELAVPLVYVGSGGIYAASDVPAAEDARIAALPDGGYYGLTKWLGELALSGLVPGGLSLCVLRPSSIYGAGINPSKLVAKMLGTARKRQTILVHPPIDDSVNLVHAYDVAVAAIQAVRSGATGVFNIAGPSSVTMSQLAEACIHVAGGGSWEEEAASASLAPRRRFDLDGRKAEQTLGFGPSIGLHEGLAMLGEGRYVR